ncbi:MAG: HDOD domain-containing protein [Bryobacteraceae bacterium]
MQETTDKTTPDALDRGLHDVGSRPDLRLFFRHIVDLTLLASEEDAQQSWVNLSLNLNLASRVLRAANSRFSGQGSPPVQALPQAMLLLSLKTVREIAVDALLSDYLRNKTPLVHDLFAQALLTGSHARQLAHKSGHVLVEQAFACGLLRNLGELLVASYWPDEYGQILESVKRDSLEEQQACRTYLGFSWDDLARAVIRHWRLPEKVLATFDACENSEDYAVAAAVSFAHDVSKAVFTGDPAGSTGRLRTVLENYRNVTGAEEPETRAQLTIALREVWEIFSTARLPVDLNRFYLRLGDTSHQNERDGNMPGTGNARSMDPPAPPGRPRGGTTVVMPSRGDPGLKRLLMRTLSSMREAAHCDRIAFCAPNKPRTHVLGCFGIGKGIQPLIQQLRFPLSARNSPFLTALMEQSNVFVEDTRESHYRLSYFSTLIRPTGFCILPVIVEQTAVACFYLDRLSSKLILDAQKKQRLLASRESVAEALARTGLGQMPA